LELCKFDPCLGYFNKKEAVMRNKAVVVVVAVAMSIGFLTLVVAGLEVISIYR
jgi:hypothetical protein